MVNSSSDRDYYHMARYDEGLTPDQRFETADRIIYDKFRYYAVRDIPYFTIDQKWKLARKLKNANSLFYIITEIPDFTIDQQWELMKDIKDDYFIFKALYGMALTLEMKRELFKRLAGKTIWKELAEKYRTWLTTNLVPGETS